MRVAIDASAVGPGMTGIGVYVDRLLAALPGAGVTPVALGARGAGRRLRPTALWLQVAAPEAFRRSGAALAHFPTGRAPARVGLPFIATVHDLTPLTQPGWLARRERWLTAPALRLGVLGARLILAVSGDTRDAIARRFPAVRGRIRVIPEAPSLEGRSGDSDAARAALGLGPGAPLWLHVGTIEPRKNLPRLVEAFAMALASLRAQGAATLPHLVLAGPPGADSERVDGAVRSSGLGPFVVRTGRLDDTRLAGLYGAAEMLIAPSLHEGFGLAVLDALALGVPVVSSGRGALGELTGLDAAVTANPEDPAALAAAMLDLHGDAGARARLREAGLRRAAAFSWARTAAWTAEVYREALSGG